MLVLNDLPTKPGVSISIDNLICDYIPNFKFYDNDPLLLDEINEKKKEITAICRVSMKKVDSSMAAKIGLNFGSASAKRNKFVATSEYGYSFYIDQYYDIINGKKINPDNYSDYESDNLLKLTLEYSIGNRIELHIATDEASVNTDLGSLSASVSAKKAEIKCLGTSYGLSANLENEPGIAVPIKLISLANFDETIKTNIDIWRENYQKGFSKILNNLDYLKPKLIGFSVKIPEKCIPQKDLTAYLINYSYVLRRIQYGDNIKKAIYYIDYHGKSANNIMIKYKDVIDIILIKQIYKYFFEKDENITISNIDTYLETPISNTMKNTAKELLDGFMHMKK